jgi:hypothetical protein
VFVAIPEQIGGLVSIVREHQTDGRLFYPVPNEGPPLDLEFLRLVLGSEYKPPGLSTSTHPSYHPEAGVYQAADPMHLGPHNPSCSSSPPPSVVYGVAVHSVISDFFLKKLSSHN